jgi:hypothetical protein
MIKKNAGEVWKQLLFTGHKQLAKNMLFHRMAGQPVIPMMF